MNDKLSLAQVHEQVRADEDGKWDATVPLHEVLLRHGTLFLREASAGSYPNELTPTPWATTQMCQRLGIPTSYFKRCPAVLQDVQFNYWRTALLTNGVKPTTSRSPHCQPHARTTAYENGITSSNGIAGDLPPSISGNGYGNYGYDDYGATDAAPESAKDEHWMLRVKHNSLRGVLSQRYTPLDNLPLLNYLEPLLKSRFQVGWFNLSDESLHLRLVDPTLTRDILPHDQVMVGIHISNSEVGKRAITVDALVFRLVCSNGLIKLVKGKSLLHQRHIFVSEVRLVTALERAIGESLTTAAGFIEQLAAATRTPLQDVEATVERLVERLSLSQTTHDLIKSSLLKEEPHQQETLYGVINGLTSAAQALSSDNRYDLEVLAGHLVEQGLGHAERWQPRRTRALARPSSARGEVSPVGEFSIVNTAKEMFGATEVVRH